VTILAAPQIVQLVAPEFVNSPEKLALTIKLTRVMAPFLMFISLAALFMGALNSMKIFFLPSIAPAFFNVVMICSMVFGTSYMVTLGERPIYSLGIGVFLGGIVQAFIQFPLLVKAGYKIKKPSNIFGPKVKEVFNKLGPGLIGFAATQVNLIVNTIIATSTVVGAVSWLSYAFRLFQFPVGIISVSIGNSNLVHFSEAYKSGDQKKAVSFLSSSYNLSWLIILPVIIVVFLLNQEIVTIVFQRGRFLESDAVNTAKLLVVYSLGLPFYGLYKIFVPTLYALDKQKIPVLASIVSISFNIIFCWTLVKSFSYPILAAGTSISIFINVIILALALWKNLDLGLSFFINLRLLRAIGSSVLVYFASSYFVVNIYPVPSELFSQLVHLIFITALIISNYLLFLYILGERSLFAQITQRLKRK
jgi:putative peptidoglycan lipid II flippase